MIKTNTKNLKLTITKEKVISAAISKMTTWGAIDIGGEICEESFNMLKNYINGDRQKAESLLLEHYGVKSSKEFIDEYGRDLVDMLETELGVKLFPETKNFGD
jgi:hypothetical protein